MLNNIQTIFGFNSNTDCKSNEAAPNSSANSVCFILYISRDFLAANFGSTTHTSQFSKGNCSAAADVFLPFLSQCLCFG